MLYILCNHTVHSRAHSHFHNVNFGVSFQIEQLYASGLRTIPLVLVVLHIKRGIGVLNGCLKSLPGLLLTTKIVSNNQVNALLAGAIQRQSILINRYQHANIDPILTILTATHTTWLILLRIPLLRILLQIHSRRDPNKHE